MEHVSKGPSSRRSGGLREAIGGAPAAGAQSALILRLNVARLRADGLALDDVARRLPYLCPDARVEVSEATTTGELLRVFAGLAEQCRTFDVIAVVGHSHEHGIRVSDEKLANWDEFAMWLEPLEPRCLVLVACRAGRWSPARALFQRLRHLHRVFAAPVNACRDQGKLMITLMPCLLLERAPSLDDVRLIQGLLAILIGAQLRLWTRKDMDKPDSQLLELFADLAEPWLRRG